MEKRRLGRTNMDVTVLGFGGAGIAGESLENIGRVLNSALDAGINVIDTAECYEGGEESIGNAISKWRDEFFLFTKCGHPRGIGSADWSASSILESIERSLRRLQTDRIDLIQLHGCSEAVLKKGEAISALEKARERGWVRYLGYSGDGHPARFAVESDAFDALQTSISIADQEAISRIAPLTRARNVGLIAKRPLANFAWKTGHKPINSYHHQYYERLRKLNFDFLRNDEESIAIALRFVLSVPGVHTAIVGTTKPERCQENARLLESRPLPQNEYNAIRERWDVIAPKTWIGQP
ncbi:MAG: aldo/keto reductase [Verrucomicrobia bacterium]|jgi:aryl-alcohol dehydrogenase-like predicted oxidoreductase|nr:MAG: aldo/keto reductase [Verrucomicrobiota bacterium]PYM06076.1 MAG: aldo/keto reductase [Verrucomicrobiota bacterium]